MRIPQTRPSFSAIRSGRRAFATVAVAALLAVALPVVIASVTTTSAQAAPVQPYTFKNVQIGGGGFVSGIVFNEGAKDVVYARTDIGGAYRWNQASGQWEPMLDWIGRDRWGHTGVAALAADPVDTNRVYAAVGTYTNSWDGNGAMLSSADRGRTWETSPLPFKLGGNMPGRGIGERLVVDPNDNRVLYLAAPSGKGLWRSTDHGATWAQVTSFPNAGNHVPDPSADPDSPHAQNLGLLWIAFDKRTGGTGRATRDVYVGVADKENMLYRSTDGGTTWTRVAGQPTGFLPHRSVFDPVNGYLYLATSDTAGPNDGGRGDVWRYAPVTGTWTNISPVPSSSGDNWWGYSGLTIDRQNPKTLMVVTQMQWWPDITIFRSTDGGASWSRIWDWNGYPERTLRYEMDISSVPWLDWGRADEPPLVWPQLGWWAESMQIDPFDSNRFLYGTGATIFGSANLTAWDTGDKITIKPVIRGLEETSVGDLFSPPQGAPLFSGVGDVGGFRHDDIDRIPAAVYSGAPMSSVLSLDYAELKPSVIARSGRPESGTSYLAVSTDGGTTWTAAATRPPGTSGPGENGAAIAVGASGDRLLWSPSNAPVSYSTDLGATWTSSTGIPSGAHVEADRVNPRKFYGWSGDRLYASTDGGVSFSPAATVPRADDVKAVPGREGEVWAVGGGGVFRSTDSGSTFTKIAAASYAKSVGFGKPAPGRTAATVFLGGGNVDGVHGVFRSDDSGTTWVRVNDDRHQWGDPGEAITGDPRVYGRFYLGTNGRGVIVGDVAEPITTTTTTTGGSSCSADYRVVNSWPGGFQGEVAVTAGARATRSWTVTWSYANGQRIPQLWGGTLVNGGPNVTVSNTGWNGSLAPGTSTTFGFTASRTETNPAPTNITCTTG
ncbi:cellulose binding domain-containing protein [Saccharothrix yanglingensis]|uniref:Xyloglucanase n=1 Tax=Saccharothrix yanglingensis TaxID=659496 RepID=A0ABU0X8D2_9PSEU|nr:cellulose binding domain-containing protein [Saccharothrix yanglingensis]MDQ2588390.1 xyloglucanase [Saccharothrix yanglingensis]